MEQLTNEYMINFLKDHNVELASTHARLCLPMIRRMCNKMRHGIRFGEIKVCENMIIDGHHRYLSSLLSNYRIEHIPGVKTSATQTYNWQTVQFDENDWDSIARINFLNKQDAEYNHMNIETLKKLTIFE